MQLMVRARVRRKMLQQESRTSDTDLRNGCIG